MAENCGQKDVWPTSPLEEDVNNLLDSPLPCSYYGLLRLCQVNAAYMLNSLTAKELDFATTCMNAKIDKNCKAEENWGMQMKERGLCKNNASRKTQKFRHIAAKQRRHLLTLLSDAPGVLSHFYCLPRQKYIVTASSCWARGRPVTSRKEKTPLPSGSADWTAQASSTLHFCPADTCRRHRSPAPLAEHRVPGCGAQGVPWPELKHTRPAQTPPANPHVPHILAWGRAVFHSPQLLILIRV